MNIINNVVFKFYLEKFSVETRSYYSEMTTYLVYKCRYYLLVSGQKRKMSLLNY